MKNTLDFETNKGFCVLPIEEYKKYIITLQELSDTQEQLAKANYEIARLAERIETLTNAYLEKSVDEYNLSYYSLDEMIDNSWRYPFKKKELENLGIDEAIANDWIITRKAKLEAESEEGTDDE